MSERSPPPTSSAVFTVPPGRPFLTALARAILAGDLPRSGGIAPSRLDLPAWTILMPTRRAARTLQEAFLAAAGGNALLLPAIRPIAEGQEDLGLIEGEAWQSGYPIADADVPPAVGSLERVLLLTELVQAWSAALRRRRPDSEGRDGDDHAALRPFAAAGAATPSQAVRLALELARLVDLLETENVSLDRLAGLVPASYSAHWQQTLDFLQIITEFWPAHLAERGLVSPADRRNRLILAEARRLASRPPDGPVIISGVTGSVPATAELMRVVARLPNGAIVLPGLDRHLEADSFARLAERHPEHPQHGLAKLLLALGIPREAVAELPGSSLTPRQVDRNRLVAEAMRPSGTMAGWRRLAETSDRTAMAAALKGISLVETPSAEDEAEVVALILREAAETPGRSAALVSPDRLLARRVAARLESWGIRVDDSAGRPFAKTVPGTFLELVANAARAEFAPSQMMSLLKHPLTRLGLDAGDVRRRARNLEIAAFRTTYLGAGLAGVATALARARAETLGGTRRGRAVGLIRDADWAAMDDLLSRLADAFAPITSLAGRGEPMKIGDLVAGHVAVAEAVARPAAHDDTGTSPLWARDEGEAAAVLMTRLMDPGTPQPRIDLDDFADLLRTLVGSESVRTRVPVHPRLSIWGPYEARLHQPDVVVLGALNEGVWPKAADPGPWLNRGMRAALGLPAPEEEIGRAAHDITMLLGGGEVILTRSNKTDGVPMVPSRWLLRLRALLDGLGLEDALAPARPWAGWARARDLAARAPPVPPPAPKPAIGLRPRRLSVSDVETWIANPYAIYARRILQLEALPRLGSEAGASERGQVVHETLARFTRQHPVSLPSDVPGTFMAIADDVMGALGAEPKVKAFWRPRLARFADWLAETEPARRSLGSRRVVEVPGRLVLAAPAGPFELSARADRIDIAPDSLIISDYKTGSPPRASAVVAGEAPQLPLEAAMAAAGVFSEVPGLPVTGLRYIRATGGEPAGEECMIEPRDTPIAELAAAAEASLARLVASFDDPATPYRALRRQRFDYTYDDYAHLARIGEWSSVDEEGAP
ncbi:MAG: double-strand break repair protein AddB [Hyphomicrobiaceae bacterium]|nr:double-strand break repair protein AddB [Hyphomicrobiaceae bacterium]